MIRELFMSSIRFLCLDFSMLIIEFIYLYGEHREDRTHDALVSFSIVIIMTVSLPKFVNACVIYMDEGNSLYGCISIITKNVLDCKCLHGNLSNASVSHDIAEESELSYTDSIVVESE